MERDLSPGTLVAFKCLSNWRKYPLVGQVKSCEDGQASVVSWGLDGPGSETTICDVPVKELDNLTGMGIRND